MAKNKSIRWMRIFVGSANLSGDARTFSSLDSSMDPADLTGWSNSIRQYMNGSQRMIGVRGFQAVMNDTAVTGSHTVLVAPGTLYPVSVLFGGGAEPTYSDAAYLLGSIQLSEAIALDGLAPVLQSDFLPSSTEGDNVDNPFGVVLHPAVSRAATTTGTTYDSGIVGGTTAGAHANIHVIASDGGTWAFTIEDSPDGAAWATLMTFTEDGTAIGSEHIDIAGQVDRYLRAVLTRTGGTVTAVITCARN